VAPEDGLGHLDLVSGRVSLSGGGSVGRFPSAEHVLVVGREGVAAVVGVTVVTAATPATSERDVGAQGVIDQSVL
jgi:hypothetical protein